MFSPLPPKNDQTANEHHPNSLPELIRYNAVHNPDHLFCMQGEIADQNPCLITFKELEAAVTACSAWIEGKVGSATSNGEKSELRTRHPVALYVESDVGLFVLIAAMLASDIPVSLHSD